MAKTYCTIITLRLQKEPNAKSGLKVYLKIWYKEKEKGGYDVAISVLNFF